MGSIIKMLFLAFVCGIILAIIHIIFNHLGLPWYY